MAMEINNNYGSYYNNAVYSAKENGQTEKTKAETTQSSGDKVQEYYEKLCKKFPQISFNIAGGVMPCNSNKVVVNLSYDCLKKMADEPEFAKKIEWNLSGEVEANSQVYSFAKHGGVELGGRTVTYDADGNRQSSCGGMRTANTANKSSGILNTQKAAKSRMDKKREQEEYLEKIREKHKKNEEYLEELREKRKARGEYIIEMQENGSLAGKAYGQEKYDNTDLQSILDTKI